MNVDIVKLKALAEVALDYPQAPYLRCQVEFKKAANPAAVLELIADIERLKNECGEAKVHYDRSVNKVSFLQHELDEARKLFSQLRNCQWNQTAEWQHEVGLFLRYKEAK